MKEIQIKFYDITSGYLLLEAVRDCLENETYGLVSINGIKVAIDPYKYKCYGREHFEATLDSIKEIINQKLYTEYAKAILNNDLVTQNKIENIFENYGPYCPVKNMSKDNVIEGKISEILIYDELAEMYSLSKKEKIFILHNINTKFVLSGPEISHFEVVEAFNNDDLIGKLEANFLRQDKQTTKR